MASQIIDPLTSTTSTTTPPTTSSTTTQESIARPSTGSSTSVTPSSSSSSRSSSTSSSTSTSTTTSTTSTIGTTSTTSTTPGNILTSTSTMFVTSASRNVVSPTSTVGSGGSTPFLQNTGAVAGVFTVVGLIALSLIFILARNFHRRRKQEAFDRELQEATRQAAATSTGPFFDDDDDDPYKNSYNATGPGIYAAGERQFSDLSHGTHGTYSQPPLNVDSYGMREMGHLSGEMLYSSDPYAAGAAGIGVARARSMRVDNSNVHQPDYSVALKDGNSPYPAFAAPNPGHMPGGVADPFANTAKNMSAVGSGAYMGGAVGQSLQQYPGGAYSQGGKRSVDGPGQHYRAGPSAPGPPVPNRYSVVTEDMEDPYGGVADNGIEHRGVDSGDAQIVAPLPNPFERDISEEGHAKDSDMENGHGPEEPKRVLKVANE